MNGLFPAKLLVVGVAAAFAVLPPLAAAQSVHEGRTAQDRPYVIGGIGLDESAQMKAMARGFPLSITVASKSGAYLADAHITIHDAAGLDVLDSQLDAPFLLVDLAPGNYSVEATRQGKHLQRNVTIAANSAARMVFSFDVPVDSPAAIAPAK